MNEGEEGDVWCIIFRLVRERWQMISNDKEAVRTSELKNFSRKFPLSASAVVSSTASSSRR